MATKITTALIDAGAITSALITDASITADDLHTTLDLTGKTVTVATATAGDNDTSVASTAFVATAIANLADSAPETLNTLNELAAALGDDANFSTTVTNSIALKAPLASPDFTGDTTFDTSTLVVDATNNRVGIGTSSPTGTYGKLTVAGGIRTLDDNESKLELGRYSSGIANSYIKLGANSASLKITNNNDSADIFTIENGGNVGIGATAPSATLDIVGGGSSTAPTLELNSVTSTTFNHAINAFNANLTAGQGNLLVVGKEGDTKNAGYIGFKYSSAGSDNNIVSLGHWGNDWLVNVMGNGNVGIGREDPTAKLHLQTTTQAASSVAQLELATTVNANPSHINQKFSSGAGWIAMIQAEQRAGGQYGALNFWTANGDNPAQKMALNFAGDLSVGDEGVEDSPHPLHKKVEVTATAATSNAWSSSAGSNGGYDVSNNDTSAHQNRGSISAAGYYNHHVAHFSLRGNFAANTWYPFTTRTQLQSWIPGAESTQDTGMPMYFRVYTYDVSSGGGDYLAHRLTDRFWFTSYTSNSNQRHQIPIGPAMGHAPNSGAYTDHKDYGNNPIQVSINHRLGSDSYYSASQTFEIWFNSARTGLTGGNGLQVEIYAYIG